jgi:hypothetical protein
VKSTRVLNLVGDFPDVLVDVARVAVNKDDLAGELGKSFVVFLVGHFLQPPLGRRIRLGGLTTVTIFSVRLA